jgi:hypothetical protein
VSATDLEVMRRLDRLHLEFPFAGSRMLQGLLVAEGCKIGRRHVKMLMKRMGIEALYRRPRTTKPEPATRSTRICCARWRSRGQTRCGRWTSPTSRWRAASSSGAVMATTSRTAVQALPAAAPGEAVWPRPSYKKPRQKAGAQYAGGNMRYVSTTDRCVFTASPLALV